MHYKTKWKIYKTDLRVFLDLYLKEKEYVQTNYINTDDINVDCKLWYEKNYDKIKIGK